MEVFPLLLLLSMRLITLINGEELKFFCAQFFEEIRSRSSLNITLNDTTPVGTMIRSFERPDKVDKVIQFTDGDTEYIDFDYSTYSLVVRRSLRPRNGDFLRLDGICVDFIYPIAVSVDLPVSIYLPIEDENDPPAFQNLPNTIYVYENVTVGSVLYNVSVDSSYDILPENKEVFLHLEKVTALETSRPSNWRTFILSTSGSLRLIQRLDYELGPRSYKLEITAKDEGYPPQTNHTFLVIHVLDVDDESPAFTQESYYATVIGEKPIKGKEECFHSIPPVKAEDKDRSAKSEINYQIIDGNPGTSSYWGQFFKINATTGQICQLQMIQRLLQDEETGRNVFYNFTFSIRAFQVDNPSRYDESDVFIEVIDSNQYAPKFNRRLYLTTIPEYPKLDVGTKVIRLKATDKDHGLNSIFQYKLLNNPLDAFTVDPNSGWITVANPRALDYEEHKRLQFRVQAVETHSKAKKRSEASVAVLLTDVNDNTPQFSQHNYTYVVKDTQPTGLPIHPEDEGPVAVDRDSGENGRVTYHIRGVWRLSGITTFSDLGRFAVDQDSGVMRLAGTLRDLRRKRNYPEFKITLSAEDRARDKDERLSSSVDVYVQIVQANDFAPKFAVSSHRVDTSTYSLGNLPPTFKINESSPIGTVVAKIPATDEDGDADVFLRYNITDGNEDDFFRITSSGWITLKRPLDREIVDTYSLKVQVTDGKNAAQTALRVIVNDTNDNAPKFSQDEYEFELLEESPIGTLVGRVNASDPDLGLSGLIYYSLKPGKGSDLFHIATDGSIKIKKYSSLLDRETTDQISLRVIASDSGDPSLKTQAEVIIKLLDKNDNSPVFTSTLYLGTIVEDDNNPLPQIVDLEVPINASDVDMVHFNRDVRYSLSGPGSELFAIDPILADIMVVQPGTVDAENKSLYKLKVTATDQQGNGRSSTADLHVTVKDQNDNAPRFLNSINITVPGDIAIGSVIGQLVAVDDDITTPNNALLYLLQEGGFGKFSVHYETGEITIADTLLREPLLPTYSLKIQAIDGGLPRMSNQTVVTINTPINHPPYFNSNATTLEIYENRPAGTYIGKILAGDPDDRTELEFNMDDTKVPFKIGRDGSIYSRIPFDRELVSEYDFQVSVRDDGTPSRSATTTVTVKIKDVNDNAPIFNVPSYQGWVTEDDQDPNPYQNVLLSVNISAVDLDSTAEYKDVRFSLRGNNSDLFEIDPFTGHLRVGQAGVGKIDREKYDAFHLKVLAIDGAGNGIMTSEADMTIQVKDLNDESPRFQFLPSELYVHEDIQVGDDIGRIVAEDADGTSPNNEIIYVLENDPLGKFRVDVRTGRITALRGLFYQPRQELYVINIAAVDMGIPAKRTLGTVTIKVLKKQFNDYKPEFEGGTIFNTPEEIPEGTQVGAVHVVDEEKKSVGERVSLHIKSDKLVPFKVDSETGAIHTTGRLDYDTGEKSYIFSVIARGTGDPPKVATAYVGIIVDDINDNPPRFTQPAYHHLVSDNFPAGTVVATPFAYDNIDIQQSRYSYTLVGEDAGKYFTIDRQSGVVTTTDQLKDINKNKVAYIVVATDVYKPTLVATSDLIIDVLTAGKKQPTCCCKVPC